MNYDVLMVKMDSEREAFEKWAVNTRQSILRRATGEYFQFASESAWQAWQARAALAAQGHGEVGVGVDTTAEGTHVCVRLGNTIVYSQFHPAPAASPAVSDDLLRRLKVAARSILRERDKLYWEDVETLADVIKALESAAASPAGVPDGFFTELRRANDLASRSPKLDRERLLGRVAKKYVAELLAAAPSAPEPAGVPDDVERDAARYRKLRWAQHGRSRVEIRLWDGEHLTYGRQLAAHGLDAAVDALPPNPQKGSEMAEKMTIEEQARELLALEYEVPVGEGPYLTYAKLARSGRGDFTMCSVRAVMRALDRAHLTQPAQAVDVEALREVIAEMQIKAPTVKPKHLDNWTARLTRALGNAQAEGCE